MITILAGVMSHLVLICISVIISNVEGLFMNLLAICMTFKKLLWFKLSNHLGEEKNLVHLSFAPK